jgi:hypothetical protein
MSLSYWKGSKIHIVFHVSSKKALRQHVTSSAKFPTLEEEGQLVLVLLVNEEHFHAKPSKKRGRKI